MDGEDRFYVTVMLHIAVFIFEVNDRKGCLPVMCVEYVGVKINEGHYIDDCLGEEREAFAVVVMTVQRLTVEIVFVVEEIVCHAVLFEGEYAAILVAPRKTDVYFAELRELCAVFCGHLTVQRENDTDIAVIAVFLFQSGR